MKNHSKLAVLYASASPTIGGGHVMRCLTLGERLIDSGWQCVIVCTPESYETVFAIAKGKVDVLLIETGAWGMANQLQAALPEGCALLVVDGYDLDVTFEMNCRPWAKRIVVIDDLADRQHDCDILIDQTVGRSAEDYRKLTPQGAILLLGSQYALLRPEFAKLRGASSRRREHVTRPQRILVTMGLTDPGNATGIVLSALERSSINAEILVVLGSSAPHLDKVRAQVESMGDAGHLHVDHPHISELMAEADLAIGAAGSTAWERCCLGLPSMMVVLADNQEKIAHALSERGAAMILGWIKDLTIVDMATQIHGLWTSEDALRRMSDCAMAVCDGGGAERVENEINDTK